MLNNIIKSKKISNNKNDIDKEKSSKNSVFSLSDKILNNIQENDSIKSINKENELLDDEIFQFHLNYKPKEIYNKQEDNFFIDTENKDFIDTSELENKKNNFVNYKNDSNDNRSLQNFNKVYDSFSEEEVDITLLNRPKYILSPESEIKVYIDIISYMLVLYCMLISPYKMAFEDDFVDETGFFFIFDFFIDVFFILDLILNFFIAFRDNKEEIKFNIKLIFFNYIKTWFLMDLISCIPFTIINYFAFNVGNDMNFYTTNNNISSITKLQKFAKIARFFKVFKWTRIIRVLKITKSNNNANMFMKLEEVSNSVNRFLKFLFFFVILAHISACIWCFLGKFLISLGETKNWIFNQSMQDFENREIYVASIYFIITTIFSIGYGDIKAIHYYEKLYINVIMLVGCFVYSFAITSLSNILSKMDKKTEIFNKKDALLNELKIEFKIKDKLYNKIKKSLSFDLLNWNKDRFILLDSLPTMLRNQLYMRMYQNKINHLLFFTKKSNDFVTFTVTLLKSASFSKNDYIITLGEIIDEMYMTINGTVGIQLGPIHHKYEICEIPKELHFGDILMYTNQQSKLSYKVKSINSQHFVLTKLNFAQIKLNFKNDTSKNLEISYDFFKKIEKIRVVAIKYFESQGDFTNFKTYLKKLLIKQQETDSIDLVELSNAKSLKINEMSGNKKKNKNTYSSGYSSGSDIFTINSNKTENGEKLNSEKSIKSSITNKNKNEILSKNVDCNNINMNILNNYNYTISEEKDYSVKSLNSNKNSKKSNTNFISSKIDSEINLDSKRSFISKSKILENFCKKKFSSDNISLDFLQNTVFTKKVFYANSLKSNINKIFREDYADINKYLSHNRRFKTEIISNKKIYSNIFSKPKKSHYKISAMNDVTNSNTPVFRQNNKNIHTYKLNDFLCKHYNC